jgi:hypothetical protein
MSAMHDQRRRHRRISFCAPVTVRTHGARPSVARARNVSEGGMFVSVPGAVSVGAEVSCEVSIDGVRHQMRARVAWVHRDSPDRPAALGLAFCGLEDDQAAALRSLVTTGGPARDRSRVWFDGIQESIVGRTEHFEGGAVLRAALPFLELGRHVRLEPGDGESRPREGRIANIALATEPDTKVPYLRVEFALDEEREAIEVATTNDDLDVEIVVEMPEETPAPEMHVMRNWRRAMVATGVLVGLSCIALAARLASPRAMSNGLATQVAPPTHMIAPALPVPAQTATAPAVVTQPDVPVAALAAATTPTASGPQIQIGETTEIEIPLAGSTDGEAHYDLDEPAGLAINLPNAKVAFPFGDTQVGKGSVRFVRVSRRKDGIQIRLHFLGQTAPRYDVSVGSDSVRISVRARD